MSLKTAFDLGLRAYAIAMGLLAIGTALFAFGYINGSATVFGGLWIGLAAFGAVIVFGLTLNGESMIEPDRSQARCQRWESCMFTGWLLNIYLIIAAIWAGVSFGWFIGGQSVSAIPIVGYGWISIALYGAVVAAGIIATHYDFVAAAVSPTADADT